MKIFCFVVSFNYIVYPELRYVNLNYVYDWKIKTLKSLKKLDPVTPFVLVAPKSKVKNWYE